ncbi:hypothetical protein DV735_g5628, partial [Chaetothyriales sp. CBS 134920]
MAQKRKLSDAAGPGNTAENPEKKARTSQDAPDASAATTAVTTATTEPSAEDGLATGSDFVPLLILDTKGDEKPLSDTTTEALEKHFSGVAPFSLRHSTDKASGKSKGFAFIEFDHYDRMKTCLQLYHHSYFNPDAPNAGPGNDGSNLEGEAGAAEGQGQDKGQKMKSKKDKGRRINVELTAGGGGKSSRRQERIKLKNQKLAEQRERKVKRAHEQREKEKSKAAERENQGAAGPTTSAANGSTDKADNNTSNAFDNDSGNVHPSRLKMMRH